MTYFEVLIWFLVQYISVVSLILKSWKWPSVLQASKDLNRYILAKINTQRFPAQTWDRRLCRHFMNESSRLPMPVMIHYESCRSVILFRMWDIHECVTLSEAKLATWDTVERFCHSSRTRCDSSAGIWFPGRLLTKFSTLGFTTCQPHFSV